jgi:DNA-binding CsgD family transcriptional regulator
LGAAQALSGLDPDAARRAQLEALEAAIAAGRPDQLAQVARAPAPAPEQPEDAPAAVLWGLGALYGGRPAQAPAPLRRALAALARAEEPTLEPLGLLAAAELWDQDALEALSRRWLARARAELSPGPLVEALVARAQLVELARGRLGLAQLAASEAHELAGAAARPELAARAGALDLWISCWRGREPQARALVEAGGASASAQAALCLLELGLGRYQAALEAARRACPPDPAPRLGAALCDLVEAAARAGRPDEAAAACDRLLARGQAAGGDWALGVLARAQALVAAPERAEAHHRQAIARLERAGLDPERARARLLYGEWLRRQRRRREARDELRAAAELFAAIGAEAFCERARRELAATGERVRRERPDRPSPLTAQEAAIARLVREGASNPEIAARLFISRRTVEYHLSKVFTKLGVSSREELTALPNSLDW